MALSTAGILLASLLNVWVSCNQRNVLSGQLSAMQDANEITKRSVAATERNVEISRGQLELGQKALDANERAWLIGGPAKVEVRQDGVLSITTTFGNVGKSPAFFVRHNVGISGVHLAPEEGDALKGGSVLTLSPVNVPGSTVTTVTPRPDVTPEQIKLIMSGRAPFFVWLRIKYSDPFSGDPGEKTRDTLECWSYDAKRSALVVCPSGHYHR